MTNDRKIMMLKIIDENSLLVPTMHQLTHFRYCDKILNWLINNNITGKNLLEWIKINHDESILNMVQFIVKKCNKDRDLKPIIYGKDWIK